MVGIIAPDVGNLAIGKGFLLFKPEDQSTFYHLGNCPTFTFTPKVTTLDHFSSMAGSRIKDLSIVTEKSGEVKMDLEELTASNIALMVMGNVGDDGGTPPSPQVQIFSRATLIGELKFFATNEVGPRWYVDLLSVNMIPSGEFSPITDNTFAKMTVTGSVQSIDGIFGTMTLMPPVSTVTPQNVLLPDISGETGVTGPGNPKTGDVLTANIGAWIGATSYTYAWKSGSASGGPFTAIPLATNKTYTVLVGDIGKFLVVDVTGHNTLGTTVATAPVTKAVAAT